MSRVISPAKDVMPVPCIRRIPGRPGDRYKVVFLDQQDRIVVALTEWYRIRSIQGPVSTCNTYLSCLLSYFTFLSQRGYAWNAPPPQLRSALIEFHRDRLGCLIQPGSDRQGFEIVPTRDTPLRDSTLRVLRAALRDFYLVMKGEGLYVFSNPLSSEVLVALKREYVQSLANRGAPDQAGIREETREQSRRRPTAFLRHPKAQGWMPEVRKELADVREGMHKVLNALLDSKKASPREKAVLELLQNTGARLHEIVLMTVGGYRNEGIAGQAQVVNKGSMGREAKTVYFGHNPDVERALRTYIERIRPQHDLQGRSRLADVGDHEPLFLTERGAPYSPRAFYWHWYKHYKPVKTKCPVQFSPHDIRHLFISEYLIRLKLACGAGTPQFDAEQYLREREAFGSMVMGWRSPKTIDIYDHTREGERTLSVLANYQLDLSQRRYVVEPPLPTEQSDGKAISRAPVEEELTLHQEGETMWLHDAETLAWIKKMQQQKGAAR